MNSSIPQPTDEKATLKVKDVAAIFDVQPSTVYRWVESQKIPAHRTPGGQLRFKRSEIERKPEVAQ